jgi:hypothetical protein
MSTPAPATPPSAPADTPPTPPPVGEGGSPAEDLDLEEDIAPNLGGEDQMQDA